MLSHLLQNILSSLNPARIGKAAPLRGRRVTAMAKKGKASQGRWRNPGRIWGLAMVASLALNLTLVVVLVVFLYKDHSGGLGTCAAGAAKESKVAAAAPPLVQDKEDMAAGQEIAVSATSGTRPVSKDSVINLDHGDPTMFESFWRWMGDRGSIVIPAWQTMSYFSDVTNVCWFLEPEFAQEVRRLHNLIGNAVTQDRYIVVGTGSTQLFQAALYALSPSDASEPISVVSAVPYYSSYPAVTGYLRSGLFRWAGDAYTYKGDKYIELVCSPNNPDGSIREAVLNSEAGRTIHDLAYYWPQYTPISSPADHDIMLFTVSKSTGHAGTRLGWAMVKDKDVAKKMVKFIELNTIGVSKDSQLRAAKILKVVSDGYELPNTENTSKLFDYGRRLMTMRWEKLREAVKASGIFSLPEFPSSTCKFTGERTVTNPAFAWLKCEKEGIEDCESFLRSHGMLTRSGRHFGVEPKYVRVSMLDRDETFELLIERLSSLN
ncbi:tryptophan aminotransferase-related protein 1 [Cocos nucifera]|uniref:Tryptophan aminotransferase-related protein 1 n=1 Tax=Cocos nucifera TaxID=13894 RepID=A0A8K0I9F3_COCNU|nr:tryptophan aminotransferase-related protein 1 [Cocos nucifera]